MGKWSFTGGIFRPSKLVRSVGEVAFHEIIRGKSRDNAMKTLRKRLGVGRMRLWDSVELVAPR